MAEKKELWKAAMELVGEEELTRRFRVWITGIIRKARMKGSNASVGDIYDADLAAILADLNKRSGSRFGATDNARHLVISLLKQGYTVDDFCRVHEAKCGQWLHDEKMSRNLRPSTLYRPSHFDEYLAEWHRIDKQSQEAAATRERSQRLSRGELKAETRQERKVENEERQGKIRELMRKPWWSFESWADFMKHTLEFPDKKSLDEYEMPSRLREMRTEPGMALNLYKKQSPAWAEEAYRREVEGRASV